MQSTIAPLHRAIRARAPKLGTTFAASLAFAAALACVSGAQAQRKGWFIARHDTVDLTPQGQLDHDFNSGNVLTGELSDSKSSDVLEDLQENPFQTGGEIVAGGAFRATGSGPYTMVLGRYKKDGSTDTTFGIGGVSSGQAQAGASEGIDAVGFQSSTQIIVAGMSHLNGWWTPFVGRFNWNGTRDTNFGNSHGWALGPYQAQPPLGVVAMKVVAGDSILVLLSGLNEIGLIKYTRNGVLDTSFGDFGSGYVGASCGSNCLPNNFTLDGSGGILVTGSHNGITSPPEGFIMRFKPDGSVDTGWAGGMRIIPNSYSSYDAAVDPATNNIVVLSQMSPDGKVGVQRLNSRGDVEPSFVRSFNFPFQAHQSPVGIRISGNKIRLAATTWETTSTPGVEQANIGVASIVLSTFAMDPDFGTSGYSGRTVTKLPFKSASPHAFTLDKAGNLLTCGQVNGNGE